MRIVCNNLIVICEPVRTLDEYSMLYYQRTRAVIYLSNSVDSEDFNSFITGVEDKTPNTGVMSLTTRLSSPFTHLQKYPGILKELDRHTYVCTKEGWIIAILMYEGDCITIYVWRRI